MVNTNRLAEIKTNLLEELGDLANRYKQEYDNALDVEPWDLSVQIQQDNARKYRAARAALSEFEKTFEMLADENISAAAPAAVQPPVQFEPVTALQAKRRMVTVPKSIKLGGKNIPVKSWGDLLVQVCEVLIPSHTFEMLELPENLPLNIGVKVFSYDESDIKGYARKLSNGVWVETKLPSKDVKTAAEAVLKKCGVPYELIIDDTAA